MRHLHILAIFQKKKKILLKEMTETPFPCLQENKTKFFPQKTIILCLFSRIDKIL